MKTIFAEQGDIRADGRPRGARRAVARGRERARCSFSRSGATAGFQLSAGEVDLDVSSDARFETAAILLRAGKLDAATLERLVDAAGRRPRARGAAGRAS